MDTLGGMTAHDVELPIEASARLVAVLEALSGVAAAFAEAVTGAQQGRASRLIIEGQPVALVVPLAAIEVLRRAEDLEDAAEIRQAGSEPGDYISLEQLEAELLAEQ